MSANVECPRRYKCRARVRHKEAATRIPLAPHELRRVIGQRENGKSEREIKPLNKIKMLIFLEGASLFASMRRDIRFGVELGAAHAHAPWRER